MKISLRIALFAVAVGLSACVSMKPEQQAAVQYLADQKVYCSNTDDCEMKWSLAIQWVKQNSAYKFDQATDFLISTKGPLPDDPRPAFTITKVAQGGGKYEIDFDGGCANMFGCIPTMQVSKASFVAAVMKADLTKTASTAPARVTLGLRGLPVTAETAKQVGLSSPQGIILVVIVPGGIAEHGGLKAGDVLLALNDRPINALSDAVALLNEPTLSSPVQATLWREKHQLQAALQFP